MLCWVVARAHQCAVVLLLLYAKLQYRLHFSPCFTTFLQSTDVFTDVAGVSILVGEEPTAALPLQLAAAAVLTVVPAAAVVAAVVLLTVGSRKLSPL
jgi:hypothetical protein